MLVKDIMSDKIVTVPADASIHVAIELMVARNFSGVPVVDDDGCLIGLITEYDVLELYGSHPHSERFHAACADFMTPQVRTIQATAEVRTAVAIFHSVKVRRLLVVEGSRLVGVLSRRDILRCVRQRQLDLASG